MAKEGPREAIDVFLEIAKTLKNNGVEIANLDDGALRRFFNETIKTSRTKEETEAIENVKKQNEGKKEEEKIPEPQPKAKILHDSMLPNMSAHEEELEKLILKYTKEWDDKISDKFINEFEAIFNKLNDDLKNSPKWKEFWDNLEPKPENVEHVKDRILMAYRFKMFQMITGKLKTEKEPKLNEKGEPIQVPKMGEDKKPIQGEFTTVMKPKYDIKKVASLDVVLQKLNGSYDRRKAANKTLREQFNSEYENESGPSYVVDLNIMLAEAKKMRLEGATKEDIDKFIEKRRGEIRDELVKKDKFAIHVGEDQAKANFDKVFPLKMLIEKAENYEKVCKELGFDVDAMARLLEGCKETRQSFDETNTDEKAHEKHLLAHKDVLLVESYVQMLKSKVYIKSYENSKNEDIFAPFDEVKFKELEKKVEEIFKKTDYKQVADSRALFIKNGLFTAANEGDYEKFKNMVQLAAGLGDFESKILRDIESLGGQIRKTAFEIILPKLKSDQLESLLENAEIARQYREYNQKTNIVQQKCLEAAQKGDFEGLKIFIRLGANITTEVINRESILDIAQKTLNKKELFEIVKIAKEQSQKLDMNNPMQYAIVKAYAKDVHVLEYFEFRDTLQKADKLEGQQRLSAAKAILDDYILDLNPDVVALNLDGQGTPSSIVDLRDKLREFSEKSKAGNLTMEDANAILGHCKELDTQYSKYLLSKGGQLPNEISRTIISSKLPVHAFIENYHKYGQGQQSDRNYVWAAIKKNGDFNIKNLDGVKPLELAARTGNKDLVARMLDAGAKTTQYKRGFFTKLGDAFKGFPKNSLKYFNETPPRTIQEIKALEGKKFDEARVINAVMDSQKDHVVVPESPRETFGPNTEIPEDLLQSPQQVKELLIALDNKSKMDSTTDPVDLILDAPGKPPLTSTFTGKEDNVSQFTSPMTEKSFAQQQMDKIRAHYPTIDVGGTGSLMVTEKRSLLNVFSLLKEYEKTPLEKGSDEMKTFQRKLEDITKIEVKEPVKGLVDDLKKAVEERVTKKSPMRMSGTGGD